MSEVRSSPSGPLFDDLQQMAIIQIQIGWLPASGNSNIITLAPIGHVPGFYTANFWLERRVAASAGSAQRNVTFNSPNFPGTLAGGTTALNATGGSLASSTPLFSVGTAPILLQFTPVGITGNPVVDIYASIQLIAVL